MRAIRTDLPRPAIVDPGVAPMLQWIRIEQLVVDESYQRDLGAGNWTAIKKIAANFRWSRFSPVFVAPIPGGKFAIIDGQHRTHAAAACGMAEVPCQVVQMNAEEQAASFAAVNGMVTKVTTWQIFKAARAAGEEWAKEAADTAADAGCRLMDRNGSSFSKKPLEIYGVSSFRAIIASRARPLVTQALKVLAKAEGYRDAHEAWDMSVLAPLLLALTSRPNALRNPALVAEIELFPLWDVIERVSVETRDRLRKGLPYAPKKEQLEALISDWLDRKFPERMMAAE